jgi:trans-2,3-dihydro-3-hydroxyanthranilate isomerase
VGGIRFYIVDVFAEEKYAGNQLAVFRTGELSDQLMQRIAKEMHYSETTFIIAESARDGGYDVRIFTPAEEVPFAGHPTLGTAHILRTEVAPSPPEQIVLNLKVGPIPVSFKDDDAGGIYSMKQIEPTFGDRLDAQALAPVLNIEVADIDTRFPVEQVSTGLPFIIVPLRSLDALRRARVDRTRYFDLIANTWAKPVLAFTDQPHKPRNDIAVRVFVDCFDIPEDPATGSGNGCLAAYLARHRYWGEPHIDVRAEQGYEIGRPSLLYLHAEDQEGGIDVFVGGRVVTVAQGELV